MIRLKNSSQMEAIRRSFAMLSGLFRELGSLVRPGVTQKALDDFAHEYIVSRGGRPAFLGYEGYPATLCVSVNEKVIHGIPSAAALREGDIVGLDCGIDLDGYFSDAAVTYPVGTISPELERLCRVTRECLDRAIEAARTGKRIHDISRAVQSHALENGYGIVRQYCGHGVGLEVHEDPQVPNYVSSGPNPRLVPGMVLAIEPMINLGSGDVKVLGDDWTVVTIDGKHSAHYEHSIAILEDGVEVLSSWDPPF